MGNATKFTSEGGIIVGIRKIAGDAPLKLQFTVEDTGIGIAADKIDKLFRLHSGGRLDHPREYGGTGLGLSICKQLTDLMGGTLDVHSTPGKGAVSN